MDLDERSALVSEPGADRLRVYLPGERQHRGSVDVGIPQPDEQIRRAGPGDREAGGRMAREFPSAV